MEYIWKVFYLFFKSLSIEIVQFATMMVFYSFKKKGMVSPFISLFAFMFFTATQSLSSERLGEDHLSRLFGIVSMP